MRQKKAKPANVVMFIILVRAKFWSNNLKEFDKVKNIQTVIDGITIGIIILNKICGLVAPSIAAASNKSGDTFCIPAM